MAGEPASIMAIAGWGEKACGAALEPVKMNLLTGGERVCLIRIRLKKELTLLAGNRVWGSG